MKEGKKYQEVAEDIYQILQSDLCLVWRFDAEAEHFILVAKAGKQQTLELPSHVLPVNKAAPTLQAFFSKDTPIYFDDLEDPKYVKYYDPLGVARECSLNSSLIIPLVYDKHLIGMIYSYKFDSHESLNEGQEKVIYSLLSRYARQAAEAIYNVRVTTKRERHVEELNALHRTALIIGSEEEMQPRLVAIVEAATKLLNVDGGTIYLTRPGERKLVLMAGKGINPDIYSPGTTLDFGEGMSGRVIESKKPMILNDYSRFSNRLEQLESLFGAVIAVPLALTTEEPVGVLAVFDAKGNRTFNKSDISILERFARHAALTIRDAQLLQTLKKQSRELEKANAEARELIIETFDDTATTFAGQFYYGQIVHDLRHILSHIKLTFHGLSQSDALKTTSAKMRKEVSGVLHRLEASSEAMSEYLDDIVEAEHELGSYDINRIIEQVVRMFQGRIEEANIALVLDLDHSLPDIYANRIQTIMIFSHLVSNAIDALSEVTRLKTLRIETCIYDDNKRYINVFIRDNGSGIDPANMSKIFNPNFSTKHEKGRGLGLFGTRRILNKIGGDISFKSSYGKGTTFQVRLPRSSTTPRIIRKPSNQDQDKQEIVSVPKDLKPYVVIMDDDVDLRRSFRDMLKKEQLNVRIARSKAELSKIVASAHYDAAILDIRMSPGGHEGLDAIKEIKDQHPGIYIEVHTGYKDYVSSALSLGADHVLIKPEGYGPEAAERIKRGIISKRLIDPDTIENDDA